MNESLKTLFLRMGEKPIAYHAVYAKICGGHTAGLLLSQVIYWFKANKGEFHKTDEEFCEEIILGSKEFRNAKSLLVKLKFVETTKKWFPGKTFYVPNFENIVLAIVSLTETAESVWPKRSNKSDRNGQTAPYIDTETTTENKKGCEKFSEEFWDAFSVFEKHRSQKRNKLTPIARERLLDLLSKYDEKAAIAMINKTLENGWTGIFPLKESGGTRFETPRNVLTGTRDYSAGIENFEAITP